MKTFFIFVVEKYFTFVKKFLKSFYMRLYSDYVKETYVFRKGKGPYRKSGHSKKITKVVRKTEFELDKEKLLNESVKYFIHLGEFINKYSGENVPGHWNMFIWQPRRMLNRYIDLVEPDQDDFDFDSEFESPDTPETTSPVITPRSPIPLRRARRPFQEYPDTLATNDDERCKICMVNKKCIIFIPCGHVGVCNSCCSEIYSCRFIRSDYVRGPYLSDRIPVCRPLDISILSAETDEEYIEGVIQELCSPSYNRTKQCIFCKHKIDTFKIMFSV
jgi:hypothetical protein